MGYTVLSLFSGAMGLDLGLHRVEDYELLAVVEKQKVFCDTIRQNVENGNLPKDLSIYQEDIKNLSAENMMEELGLKKGELDLLIGGPPCQSFSTAGKRGTTKDARGTLLWDFLRFVEVFQPKFFLMENVRGLLSAAISHRPIKERPKNGGSPLKPEEKPGSVIDQFAKDLKTSSPDYHLDCFEVNAVNYGAPQLRERALFIGNRSNKELDFPHPTHIAPDLVTEESGTLFGDSHKPWNVLGNVIKDLKEDNPTILDFSERKKKFLSMVPPGGNWRHLPEEVQKESMGKAFHAKGGRSGWWRRLSYELPSPTLVTMPNHASTSLCHPTEIRALTLREYCRIQEFPDRWEVCGSPARQYEQIGNAVPVRLGEVAGQVIKKELMRRNKNSTPSKKIENQPFRRVYLNSHVRTRHWFKNGTALSWNTDRESATYKTNVSS